MGTGDELLVRTRNKANVVLDEETEIAVFLPRVNSRVRLCEIQVHFYVKMTIRVWK